MPVFPDEIVQKLEKNHNEIAKFYGRLYDDKRVKENID